jgi:hypothetical protein
MPVQVKVGPKGIAAALGAAQYLAVKLARGLQVVNGYGDVEGLNCAHVLKLIDIILT